jgi:hypothetical protein
LARFQDVQDTRKVAQINTPAIEPGVRGVEAWSGNLLLLMFKPALCLLGLAEKFLFLFLSCSFCSDRNKDCNRCANVVL